MRSVAPSFDFPNIADLINDGDITVGIQRGIGCIATACTEDSCLAMLARRKNESLLELLTRLDQAIAKTSNEGIFTDEINPPPNPIRPQEPRLSRRSRRRLPGSQVST